MEEELEIRVSRWSLYMGLMICIAMLAISCFGSTESSFFTLGRILIRGFALLCIIFLTVSSVRATSLTASGIRIKSLRVNQLYRWEEIDSWGTDAFPNGEITGVWIKATGRDKKIFLCPTPQGNEFAKIKEVFRSKCDRQIERHRNGEE